MTGAYTFILTSPIQAQLQERQPARCRSTFLSSDDFRELIGEKVYPKIVIDEVKFEGANHLPDANRDQLIASLEDREFSDEPNWVADPEQHVREFWLERGYFKVNVTAKEEILPSDPTRRHAAVVFHVEEGIQYRLKDIRFQSSDPEVPLEFPPDQLRKLIPMQDGDIFRVGAFRNGLHALKDLYESKGYIDFVSVPGTDFDDASQQVSLFFWLDQESQFRTAKIDFLGNRPQAETIVRSQMKVGEIFSTSAIKGFYHQNKPILPVDASPLDVEVTRDQKNGTVNLVFDFRDCPH